MLDEQTTDILYSKIQEAILSLTSSMLFAHYDLDLSDDEAKALSDFSFNCIIPQQECEFGSLSSQDSDIFKNKLLDFLSKISFNNPHINTTVNLIDRIFRAASNSNISQNTELTLMIYSKECGCEYSENQLWHTDDYQEGEYRNVITVVGAKTMFYHDDKDTNTTQQINKYNAELIQKNMLFEVRNIGHQFIQESKISTPASGQGSVFLSHKNGALHSAPHTLDRLVITLDKR